jgi:hypothetical protein
VRVEVGGGGGGTVVPEHAAEALEAGARGGVEDAVEPAREGIEQD